MGSRDKDYTPEKLAQQKEHNRLYQQAYQQALRADPTRALKARTAINNAMQALKIIARQDAAKAIQKYYHATCDVNYRDNTNLVKQNKIKRVRRMRWHLQ